MKTIAKILPPLIGLAVSGVIAYYGEAWAGDNEAFGAWLALMAMASFIFGFIISSFELSE